MRRNARLWSKYIKCSWIGYQTLKADNKVVHPGFEWFNISFAREAVINACLLLPYTFIRKKQSTASLPRSFPSWGVHIFTYYSKSKLDKIQRFLLFLRASYGNSRVRRGFLLRNALTFDDDALFLVLSRGVLARTIHR